MTRRIASSDPVHAMTSGFGCHGCRPRIVLVPVEHWGDEIVPSRGTLLLIHVMGVELGPLTHHDARVGLG